MARNAWRDAHPEEWKLYTRAYYAKNKAKMKEQMRRAKLLHLYGITIDQYEAMFVAQGGRCAICKRPPEKKPLVVDHNHKTGQVRALLCNNCNTAIGMLQESTEAIATAYHYLKYYESLG